MADYVDQGYVDQDYVEGDVPASVPVVCDLSTVNTKLDLILTKLSSISSRLDLLENNVINEVSHIGNDILNTNITQDFQAIISSLNKVPIVDNSVAIARMETKIDDVRTTLTNEVPTIEQIKSIVPIVNEYSLRVFPNGTKVKVIGVHSGTCTVLSSTLVPDTDYTYLVQYTVRLDGTDRVSNFLAPQVTDDLNAST